MECRINWCLFIGLLAHVVNGQVRPAADLQDALQTLGLTKFLQKLKECGLNHILYNRDKYTLFAPTNEAFAKFEARIIHSTSGGSLSQDALKQILLYHIAYSDWRAEDWKNDELIPTALTGMNIRVNIYEPINGRKGAEKITTLSGVQVLSNNNRAGNGIVHVLNDVVYPMPMASTYDTLMSYPYLSNFKHILDEFNTMKLLRYEEPLTVFAPINDAFEKLPPQFMDNLSSQMTAMAAIVNYHFVNGTYFTAGLFRNTRLHTMESSEIVVAVEANDSDSQPTKINGDARILHSYPTSNGVLHVVDTLLFPPANPKQMFYAIKDGLQSQNQMRRRK